VVTEIHSALVLRRERVSGRQFALFS
jgi:hypothetical protein